MLRYRFEISVTYRKTQTLLIFLQEGLCKVYVCCAFNQGSRDCTQQVDIPTYELLHHQFLLSPSTILILDEVASEVLLCLSLFIQFLQESGKFTRKKSCKLKAKHNLNTKLHLNRQSLSGLNTFFFEKRWTSLFTFNFVNCLVKLQLIRLMSSLIYRYSVSLNIR